MCIPRLVIFKVCAIVLLQIHFHAEKAIVECKALESKLKGHKPPMVRISIYTYSFSLYDVISQSV